MSKIFYLSEILQFAVEKEQQAADLYRRRAREGRIARARPALWAAGPGQDLAGTRDRG